MVNSRVARVSLWSLSESHPLYGLMASPVPPESAGLFLLGTSISSAEMAAELGIPYVFPLFLNSDQNIMSEAIRLIT
ncbi:MAG: hypothetical protein Ct9H300mP11_32890 [Chloroflexota bacterium]|nr:MAG: hypothetical protein Ct9H300mP11_32890 [Chloroflexota bacterium]